MTPPRFVLDRTIEGVRTPCTCIAESIGPQPITTSPWVDADGRVVARGRVDNDAAGFAQLLTLLAEAGDTADDPIPVGIETDHGLWVAALRATGRVIYPINPLAASRYRARYGVSGAKSDATDAVVHAVVSACRTGWPPSDSCWMRGFAGALLLMKLVLPMAAPETSAESARKVGAGQVGRGDLGRV